MTTRDRKKSEKPAAPLGITATPSQMMAAVGPISTIVEEKWPLGFAPMYWMGRLLTRLTAELEGIEKGRQALLRQFAELTESGEVKTNADGVAVFPPGAYPRFQEKWAAARAQEIVLENVCPLRVSEIDPDALKKLRANQINGAPLGALSGTPFFVEDAPLLD